MLQPRPSLGVVIPAAGIGKRMQADKPKQYLTIHGKTILEHTLEKFVALDIVEVVIVAIAAHDTEFSQLAISQHSKIKVVDGGAERADSVNAGIKAIQGYGLEWVMVHDAARPCVPSADVQNLFEQCVEANQSGILALPCRDTMKRGSGDKIDTTVDRTNLWHALTPQCSRTGVLAAALEQQTDADGQINKAVTDEASALEMSGQGVLLVEGSGKNIKVTLPEDLELAQIFISSES